MGVWGWRGVRRLQVFRDAQVHAASDWSAADSVRSSLRLREAENWKAPASPAPRSHWALSKSPGVCTGRRALRGAAQAGKSTSGVSSGLLCSRVPWGVLPSVRG